MRRALLATLSLAAALGACTMPNARPARAGASVTMEPGEAWRGIATAEDATRVDAVADAWRRATERVGPATRKAIAAEGALLDPAAALDHPELSPGSYSCRVLRLQGGRLRSFPAQFCYVQSSDGKALALAKQTGSDLPAGVLYPGGERRYVFLGARQNTAGDTSLAYGADRSRDVAGVVERVAPFRWRLVLPRDGRDLDILELTPVPVERQPG